MSACLYGRIDMEARKQHLWNIMYQHSRLLSKFEILGVRLCICIAYQSEKFPWFSALASHYRVLVEQVEVQAVPTGALRVCETCWEAFWVLSRCSHLLDKSS